MLVATATAKLAEFYATGMSLAATARYNLGELARDPRRLQTFHSTFRFEPCSNSQVPNYIIPRENFHVLINICNENSM